jgi:ABC-2 type transport system permease protein
VYFPLSVVPEWLQKVAAWIPLTYALSAMRGAVLEGRPLAALVPDLRMLALFAAVLIPLSMAGFSAALTKARRDGSLAQY